MSLLDPVMIFAANLIVMFLIAGAGLLASHPVLAAAVFWLLPPLMLAEFQLLMMWRTRSGIFARVKSA